MYSFQKRVRDDMYFKHKEKIDEEKKMFGDMVEVLPVDMNGFAVTTGKKDQEKNLKQIATEIQERVGC